MPAAANAYAVAQPVRPPPMMTTSVLSGLRDAGMKERARRETDRPRVPGRSESSILHFMLSEPEGPSSGRPPPIAAQSAARRRHDPVTRESPAPPDWSRRRAPRRAPPTAGRSTPLPRHTCAFRRTGSPRERRPYLPLKRRRLHVERQIEPRRATGEVPRIALRPVARARRRRRRTLAAGYSRASARSSSASDAPIETAHTPRGVAADQQPAER